MSRYSTVIKLVKSDVEYTSEGTPDIDEAPRIVFANNMNIGLATWSAARNNGLHADASVQIRSCDYRGEQTVLMNKDEYEVERVQDKGEFTTLTLKRRVSNE